MKHFRINAKKKYLYDNYRYYPQYKKNILCPYRYLRKEDIVGLDLCALNNLFNWYHNVDSDGRCTKIGVEALEIVGRTV